MTPLRRLFARHLLGIQVPLVALLLGLVWWGSRALLLDRAQREGEGRLRIAIQALDQRLRSVEQAGDFLATYWRQGRLPFTEPEANAALLMPWLFHQDGLRLLNLVDEQGRSLLIIHVQDGWHARDIRQAPEKHLHMGWNKADANGLLTPRGAYRDLHGYDARQRPWYQEARRLSSPRWSIPYHLDPPEARLVMTWLVPLISSAGQLEGALGLDLLAGDLQGLLDLLRPTQGSRIWLLDQQGLVLSAAHGQQAEAPVPPTGDRTTIAGLRQRVLRSDVPQHEGSHWHMVMAIPEQDLLAMVQGKLLGFTAAAFVLLLVPLFWSLWLGRRLSEDVQSLASAADQVGAGVAPHLPPYRVSEFDTVGQALQRAYAEIQDRNALQLQLQHSQRLETLGTLAGGIAHDVNNHLTAILAQIYLVRETIPRGHASDARLAQAEEAANNCAKTTRTLLAFSRQGHPDLQLMDLNDLLSGMADLLNGLLGGLVKVTLDLEPTPLRLRGDRLQLEQVIMNLAVNARDAMPEGGRLFLCTRRCDDGRIEMSVKDTGSGIPTEALTRIFEPFFTTKPVGKGTGLGLSMVHGIVQSHGGRIEVESTVDQGTTFTLTFPSDPTGPQKQTPLNPIPMPQGTLSGRCILVVEDEEYLLEILEEALIAAGATVVGARSGEAAWGFYREGSFDCVLSDQRMPGMTGLELYRRIRRTGSAIPFILTSGQDMEPFREELSLDARARLLTKPFSVTRLMEVMDDIGLR